MPETDAAHCLIPVPYYAQVASPEWVERVFELGIPPQTDPAWSEWGFEDPGQYEYWCWRACGAVCVKMICEAFDGPVLPVAEWIRCGMAINGYERKTGTDGRTEEIGWRHQALAEMLRSVGLQADHLAAQLPEIAAFIQNDELVIASVSYELGTARPVTRRGGHLVVVNGCEIQNGELRALTIQNPSGRSASLRENVQIDIDRFTQAYAGRIVRVGSTTRIGR